MSEQETAKDLVTNTSLVTYAFSMIGAMAVVIWFSIRYAISSYDSRHKELKECVDKLDKEIDILKLNASKFVPSHDIEDRYATRIEFAAFEKGLAQLVNVFTALIDESKNTRNEMHKENRENIAKIFDVMRENEAEAKSYRHDSRNELQRLALMFEGFKRTVINGGNERRRNPE